MRKIVYISGPISAEHAVDVAQNIHKFDMMENILMKSGYAPINPASDWNACKLGGVTREMFMETDEAMVKVSDYVFALPGCSDSPGAQQEHEWAREVDVPIVHSLDELHNLLEDDWIAELVPNA